MLRRHIELPRSVQKVPILQTGRAPGRFDSFGDGGRRESSWEELVFEPLGMQGKIT
jgi:hypothetical protein